MHALTRWIQRAPRGLKTEADLRLAAETGRVVREEGPKRWVVGLGMVLVIKEGVVVTCWPATGRERPMSESRQGGSDVADES